MFPFFSQTDFKSNIIKYDTKVLPFISYIRYSQGFSADAGTERGDAAALENERRYCLMSHFLRNIVTVKNIKSENR